MRYVSINELDKFSFHDAVTLKFDFQNSDIVWEIDALNVTSENSQNDLGVDMCIDNYAVIIFGNAIIESISLGAYTVHNSKGDIIESHEAVTAMPDKYISILQDIIDDKNNYVGNLEEYITLDDGRYKARFSIFNKNNFYYITIIFDKSIVNWDKFYDKAWYEVLKEKE